MLFFALSVIAPVNFAKVEWGEAPLKESYQYCRTLSVAVAFNDPGMHTCPSELSYMSGLFRNIDPVKKDKKSLHNINAIKCCTSSAYSTGEAMGEVVSWAGKFHGEHMEATCPEGHFITGLERDKVETLDGLIAAKCYKPAAAPATWGECYDQEIPVKYQWGEWANCDLNYYMVGMVKEKKNSMGINGIKYLKCCKMAESSVAVEEVENLGRCADKGIPTENKGVVHNCREAKNGGYCALYPAMAAIYCANTCHMCPDE